jgi:hypothetical protein
MSSLYASLQKRPDLDVRRFVDDAADEDARVASADVILFDLAADPPAFAIRAMQRNLAVLLVGVDLTSHKMLVLSGRESNLLTAEDLVRVVGQTRESSRQTVS